MSDELKATLVGRRDEDVDAESLRLLVEAGLTEPNARRMLQDASPVTGASPEKEVLTQAESKSERSWSGFIRDALKLGWTWTEKPKKPKRQVKDPEMYISWRIKESGSARVCTPAIFGGRPIQIKACGWTTGFLLVDFATEDLPDELQRGRVPGAMLNTIEFSSGHIPFQINDIPR